MTTRAKKKISKMGYNAVLQEMKELREAGHASSARYAQLGAQRDELVKHARLSGKPQGALHA